MRRLLALTFAAIIALQNGAAAAQTPVDARGVKSGSAKLSDIVSTSILVAGWKADESSDGLAGTNNAAAFTEAVNRCPATGAGCEVVLPGGRGRMGPVTITRGVSIRGSGHGGHNAGLSGVALSGTVIRCTSTTTDCITVATQQSVAFRDLQIEVATPALSTTASAGACIAFVGDKSGPFAYARSPVVDHVLFRRCFDGVRLDYTNGWAVTNSTFQDVGRHGVNDVQYLADLPGGMPANSVDFGDWRYTGNICEELDVPVGTGDSCLYFTKGGSGVVSGNKFLGLKYHIRAPIDGGPTGTMLVSGNSFEQAAIRNIDFTQAASGKDFCCLSIIGNQFANQVNSLTGTANGLGNIHIGMGTPTTYDDTWIRNVQIIGNSLNNIFNASQGAVAMIHVQDGQGVTVAFNTGTNNSKSFASVTQGVPLVAMTDNVRDAQAAGNYAYRNPAGTYGTMVAGVAVSDTLGGIDRVRGDREQVVSVIDPNNRVIDVLKPLAGIAGWTTVKTFGLASMSGLTGYGTLRCTLQGHTAGIGFGSLRVERDFSFYAGAWSIATIGTDVAGTAQAPQFQLVSTTSPAQLQLQVRSANGTNGLTSGLIDCRVRLPNADGGQATWTVSRQRSRPAPRPANNDERLQAAA